MRATANPSTPTPAAIKVKRRCLRVMMGRSSFDAERFHAAVEPAQLVGLGRERAPGTGGLLGLAVLLGGETEIELRLHVVGVEGACALERRLRVRGDDAVRCGGERFTEGRFPLCARPENAQRVPPRLDGVVETF